jgi:alkylhydroperoxidase/carboxymuconolactone decarboxylase family protein YurZ
MPSTSSTAPVFDTIAAMTAASVERCHLDADELVLVRLAALAAMGAGPASYVAHVGVAVDTGVTVERVQDVLIGVAPVIGTPRVVAAAAAITEALGLVIAVAEALEDPGAPG